MQIVSHCRPNYQTKLVGIGFFEPSSTSGRLVTAKATRRQKAPVKREPTKAANQKKKQVGDCMDSEPSPAKSRKTVTSMDPGPSTVRGRGTVATTDPGPSTTQKEASISNIKRAGRRKELDVMVRFARCSAAALTFPQPDDRPDETSLSRKGTGVRFSHVGVPVRQPSKISRHSSTHSEQPIENPLIRRTTSLPSQNATSLPTQRTTSLPSQSTSGPPIWIPTDDATRTRLTSEVVRIRNQADAALEMLQHIFATSAG